MIYFDSFIPDRRVGELNREKTNKIKAVIFDMGGVLLRTEDQTPREQLAAKYGLSPAELYRRVFDTEVSWQGTLGKVSDRDVWQSIGKDFQLTQAELDAFEEAFWKGDILDRDLIVFIDQLRKICSTALLSNAWSGARSLLRDHYNVLHVFDVVVFSCEVGLAKPDPQIYACVIEKLGVRPDEAVFIDDVPHNIDAARQAGLQGIVFGSTQQVVRELSNLLGLPASNQSL
jgi:glucose-1-phosphatase